MALAVDAVSSAVGAGSGPFSWGHSNAGDLLMMSAAWYKTLAVLGTPTFNGDAMTAVPGSLLQTGDFNIQWFYLIAPDIGTYNIETGFGAEGTYDCGFGAVSFTGADQTTPYGTPVTGGSVSTSFSAVVTSAVGEIVLDGTIIIHSGTYTVGAGQTSRWNAIASNGYTKVSGSSEAGAASVTMSWDNTSTQFQIRSALPIKPLAVGGDPEGLLFGSGKLVGGGLLQRGVLIG